MLEERIQNLIDENQPSIKYEIIMEEFGCGVLTRDHLFKIVSATNVSEKRNNNKTHTNNGCTKFELTNGKDSYFAIEEVVIPTIPTNLKDVENLLIFVKKGVELRREVLMLDSKSCVIFTSYYELVQNLKNAALPYLRNRENENNRNANARDQEEINEIDPDLLLELQQDPDFNVQQDDDRQEAEQNNVNIDFEEFKEFYEDL